MRARSDEGDDRVAVEDGVAGVGVKEARKVAVKSGQPNLRRTLNSSKRLSRNGLTAKRTTKILS
jgi:hypothetical protein